jgi:hypothetical protein
MCIREIEKVGDSVLALYPSPHTRRCVRVCVRALARTCVRVLPSKLRSASAWGAPSWAACPGTLAKCACVCVCTCVLLYSLRWACAWGACMGRMGSWPRTLSRVRRRGAVTRDSERDGAEQGRERHYLCLVCVCLVCVSGVSVPGVSVCLECVPGVCVWCVCLVCVCL